ncbi:MULTISPECIES: SLC13 family permease [unclassified Synechocystis]|uniref:SLC13 family permease n=1 Tax=unclassified Synechocystis TaxID=2640012 RepID=UPI00041E98D3|nr:MULTISPECIES: SLC13 family permease [unclassified Synechocystis]AIE73189.1 sulfur deprivation response regulator [Synechocystis sp. PCC 6714]MCT0254296.1 anion permease [Synechocystis sp. CS-94]
MAFLQTWLADYQIPLTLAVIVFALMMFVLEWLPIDTTAILVAVILMVLGLVTPTEGIAGFSNSATVTIMAMFILSYGITRTGIIQIIRDSLIKFGGNSLRRQLLLMGMIVGPSSAFLNNTAIVAIFLPIIEEWARQRQISVSKLLIPLSYATILGGMITLLGTSTSILASGLAEKLTGQEFSIFQFTPLGLLTFTLGLTYIILAAPILLPARRNISDGNVAAEYQIKDYVSEIIIPPRSSLIGQTLRQSEIQRKFDIDVLEIIHNDTHFPQPLADRMLTMGDILLVRAGREDLLRIKDERGVEILADVQFVDTEGGNGGPLESSEEKVAEVLILSNSRLIGSTLKDLRFRQRYNATVIAIRRGEELIRQRLGKVRLKFGDLLLLQGPRESFLGLQTTRELLVLEEKPLDNLRLDKAKTAIAIVALVIIVAGFDILPISVTSWAGVMAMVISGCLKPGEIYGAIRWDVIFLLAGLIPLGTAMENSGTTAWFAGFLADAGGHLSGYALLLLFYLATALLTEILSNNATVVLMLPIAFQVAQSLGLNALAFMFVVTFAASNSFMSPIGYQTNTMVYGPGGYRFTDFARIGAPLTVILTLATPLLVMLIYGV